MTSNNKEIEIQVEIQNSKKLLKFLTSEAKYIATKNQLDEYFTPKDNNFVLVRPVKEWLRLRDAEGKYSINYKCWHFKKDGTSSYCDEYETKLEDIDKMRKIFKSLGYKSLVKVRKIRKIWVYKDYEISIDTVKGLGDSVEIEYIGKHYNVKPDRITKEMIDFLKEINVGKITRNFVGYPFRLLFPKEVEYIVQ